MLNAWYDSGMKVAKVAVSLPGDLIAEVDRERRATQKTRSAYFREVLERHLRESSRTALTDAYVRGYRDRPETADEIAEAEATSVEAFAEVTWE